MFSRNARTVTEGGWRGASSGPMCSPFHEHLPEGAELKLDRKNCRQVIAVSESVRDDLVRRFELPGEMVTVIASGVETASVPDLPLPLEPGRVPVIGTAGPLEAVKGLPWFLGAAPAGVRCAERSGIPGGRRGSGRGESAPRGP